MEGDEVDPVARPTGPELGFEADSGTAQRASELAEFHARLAALTPRAVVTPTLVGVNVVVFAVMVARGVSPLSPSVDHLLGWGANQGRLVAEGQWWRLVTSMFLHVGVIHLLMNMWVLWDAGRLVERMFGPVAFAAAYLLAGFAGSCASARWSPDGISAGASGAIFGIFGLLAAFLLRQRRVLPPGALRSLGRSALVFIGYNVIYGLSKPNIDMAAHLGGLAGGFFAGLPLVRELTPAARAGTWRRAGVVLAAGVVAVLGLVAAATRLFAWQARASLVERELPGAAIRFPVAANGQDQLAYDEGRIRAALADGSPVTLGWHSGKMSSDAELRREILAPLLETITPGQQESLSVTEAIDVAGGKGLRYAARDAHGRVNLMMSTWRCGKRVFRLKALFAAAALEPSIRRTFICKPDPARDGKIRLPDVELGLGPEFGLIDSRRALAFQSLDGEVMLVTKFPTPDLSDEADDDFMLLNLPRIATGMGIGAPSFAPRAQESGPAGDRSVWRGKGRKDDKPVRLLAVEIRCDPDDYLAIYIGTDTFPEARALVPILAARCTPHPAEPPLISDLAKAACAGGDERGCTLKLDR